MDDPHAELQEKRERLRRWGWVSVALGLPGLGLNAWAAYHGVTGSSGAVGFLMVEGALLALPLALGVYMIVTGFDGADETVAAVRSIRGRVAKGAFVTLAIAVGGVVVMSAPLCGCSTRAPAYAAAIRSDLKNLASQEEIFFSDHRTYSEDVRVLGFVHSEGVHVQVRASQSGFSARARHSALGPDVGCAVWWGDISAVLPTAGGQRPPIAGEIFCDEGLLPDRDRRRRQSSGR
jgi:hypothetical protein